MEINSSLSPMQQSSLNSVKQSIQNDTTLSTQLLDKQEFQTQANKEDHQIKVEQSNVANILGLGTNIDITV
jgi:hypothetical protein